MQMVAFIHDEKDASKAVQLLNNSAIEATLIRTGSDYAFVGAMAAYRMDGYQIMVHDDDMGKAQELIFEHFPALRPAESEIIASSIIQSDWRWLKYVIAVFVIFLIYCALFFKG